jgi:hypothetical protein
MSISKQRVLGRVGARELTPEEMEAVTGSAATACTFQQTHPKPNIIDDLVDDCGPI